MGFDCFCCFGCGLVWCCCVVCVGVLVGRLAFRLVDLVLLYDVVFLLVSVVLSFTCFVVVGTFDCCWFDFDVGGRLTLNGLVWWCCCCFVLVYLFCLVC